MGLTAAQSARLAGYLPLVKQGKLVPGGDEWRDYVRLSAALKEGRDVAEEDLVLEATAPPAGVATQTLQQKAEFYEVSRRTIINWKRAGAPLSDPAAMVGWWHRKFPGIPLNQGIAKALLRVSPTGAVAPPAAERPSPWRAVPGAEAPAGDPVAVDPDDIGFDQTHRRLLEEEARLGKRISQLEAEGRSLEADALRGPWLQICERLRTAETSALRNALQRGDLLAKGPVEEAYRALVSTHPRLLRAELKLVREQLPGPPPADLWDREVDRVLDEIFRGLPEKLAEALA